jgi:hypothetical protein
MFLHVEVLKNFMPQSTVSFAEGVSCVIEEYCVNSIAILYVLRNNLIHRQHNNSLHGA